MLSKDHGFLKRPPHAMRVLVKVFQASAASKGRELARTDRPVLGANLPSHAAYQYLGIAAELNAVTLPIHPIPEDDYAEFTTQSGWFMPCPSPYGGPGWICHISGPTVCLLGRRPFTSNGRDAWIPHPIDARPHGLHRGPGGLGAGLRRHDSAAAFDARPGRVPSIHGRACDWRVLLDQ